MHGGEGVFEDGPDAGVGRARAVIGGHFLASLSGGLPFQGVNPGMTHCSTRPRVSASRPARPWGSGPKMAAMSAASSPFL